ncbi:SUF system Fe-S cluster assembly regulator [Parathalassolituus penaei]|uniref:SUF system Fe-S cluster assembly regulator n=1 Tax=Parathalassolituus penaei TaxID=2997323 RepID=A0A9X3IRR5_9GAMM|nr:SUF system Fe-S cluster assembly regulator [Parathalassolituus penaei]MCY0964119.1 SUF system Fe-S cluster assembly regulator [Parathalassolituus penaei]
MKISKMTDYGVLVLNHLSRMGATRQSTEEIAEATSLALPTARKVLKLLVDAGLVQARRGARGGYWLTRSPEQIPLLAIVEAFEGKVQITECSSTDEHGCEITDSCSLSDNWGGINQVLVLVLSSITLGHIREPASLRRWIQNWSPATDRIPLIQVD